MSTESTSHAAVLRRLLLRLHFYAGILIAPFLLLSAVTGLLYTASFQVEDFLYEDYRTVEEGGERLDLAEQVRAAAEAHPDWTVTAVRPAAEPDAATGVIMDDGVERETSTAPIVFVDPYTGEITGDLTTYGSSQALPVREWVSNLHRHLHLGEPGRIYSELAASWLWVVVLGGVVLWIGRRRRPARLLWPRRGVTGRAGTLAWHGPVGLWLAAVLLFLSATGLTWSRFAGDHIGELRAQLDWQTPTIGAAHPQHDSDEYAAHGSEGGHDHGAHRHGTSGDIAVLDEVDDAARGVGLEGPLELTLPTRDGEAFLVAEISRSHPVQQDQIHVQVDASGAAVIEELRFADWPFMAQVTNVLIAAHMGLLFGLPNQLVLAAAMVALIALIGWGYRMWWQRRPRHFAVGRPYPRGGLRRLPWPLIACLVPVVAAVGWFVPLLGISLVVFLAVDVLIGLWRRHRPEPEEAAPSEGVTRRTALGAATATAALGAGVGMAIGSNHEHDEAGHAHAIGGSEPFFGQRQSGIATALQEHATFAAFDLAADATAEDLRMLLAEWSEAAAALMRGENPPKLAGESEEHFDAEAVSAGLDPARLTVTFGLGPALFTKTGLDAAQPTKLSELPEFDGDRLHPAWSGGDLLIQICSDDRQVVSGAFLELRKRAVGVGAVRWTQQGFASVPAGGGTPRNLLGFKDGTGNAEPGGVEFDAIVWAEESEPSWFEGGTYMVFRKIRIRLPEWSATTAEEQHLTFGRARDSGAPLSGGGEFDHPDFTALDAAGLPAVPADSHVALTHMTPMFRRGFNYDYGRLTRAAVDSGAAEHPYDAGLLFASFQADPEVFIETQEKMAASDRLRTFIVAEGSAVFAIPPGAGEGGFVAEGLFGS